MSTKTMTKPKKIKGYAATRDQLSIHDSKARYKIIAAGRRWGKNYFAHNDMMKNSWTHPSTITWWCSPVHRQAKRDYRRFVNWFGKAISQKWDSDLRITLKNNSVIEFFGLEEHENIEGEGLDFLYIDEGGKVKSEAVSATLLPMLLDKKGTLTAFGKPRGCSNWFYDYFEYGKSTDPQYADYECWQFKSIDNPYVDADDIAQMKLVTPESVFRQEYEAEFLDDVMGVFRGYKDCINDDIIDKLKPEQGKRYRIGVDLAKQKDWTVLIVMDLQDKTIVGFERFNQLEWSFQKQRIHAYGKYWNNAEIIIDATGVGDPIYEDLKNAGLIITPYRFTNQSKIALIENLIITIQNRAISYPLIPVLFKELEKFSCKITPSSNIQYTAPAGYHDDCVISLALAVWDESQSFDINIFKQTSKGSVQQPYQGVMI